jgi:hypothetical protein
LAEHWDLPITGIFYSKDVASLIKKLVDQDLKRKKSLMSIA